MLTSWKTTFGGIMTATGAAILGDASTTHYFATLPHWLLGVAMLLTVIGPIIMGSSARDNSVTSEQAGAKSPSNNIAATSSRLGLVIIAWGLVAFGLGLCGLMTGCKATLQPGGAYAPATFTTNLTAQGVAVVTTNLTAQADYGLLAADMSYKLAYETVDGVFQFELNNRQQLETLAPAIKTTLDKIRPVVWDIDQRWTAARQLYKANPTPANLSTMQLILAEIEKLVPIAAQQMTLASKLKAN